MGNCQAIDNSTLAIQHPCGRVDKLYWPVTAAKVMKMNPGHHVALLLTITTTTTAVTTTATTTTHHHNNNSVRVTRIKLLRPTDTLILGQVYRLVTTQDVMKGLWAKKHAKMKKRQPESTNNNQGRMKKNVGSDFEIEPGRSEMEKTNQVLKHERHRPKTPTSANSGATKSKAWQPSLQSISEATS
ncbi:hypothetical protein U1Q18_007337 [Sarracenia purpurea var. burkii]